MSKTGLAVALVLGIAFALTVEAYDPVPDPRIGISPAGSGEVDHLKNQRSSRSKYYEVQNAERSRSASKREPARVGDHQDSAKSR
jgi:hypothetical protein